MPNIHVGSPPIEWERWESNLVHFHSFESISTEKGHWVWSPKFSCCNHEWRVVISPGGRKDSDDGKVSLFLHHCLGSGISAKYGFLFRDARGKVVEEVVSAEYQMFEEGQQYRARGWCNFAERTLITNPSNKALNHGTLTVEVRIKPGDDHCCLNFIPKNEFTQDMLQSFMDEDTADVVFEVKGQVGGAEDESLSVIFHAHQLVLQFRAKGSTLASLCEEYDKSTPVPIGDIDPQVFRKMLYYLYGGNIAAAEWKARSKDLIDAADRYGVKNLKIEAEAWYVKHLKITVENVVDTVAFADEKNCFLLKEAATSFILSNGQEVLSSDSFQGIPESKSLMREIISLATMKRRGDGKRELEDPAELSMNELRAELYNNGEDIDGPRNRLISQLVKLKKRKMNAAE
ncbi:hypothetical protein ACHAXR_004437 [Thalassiosira sp. AJA248-18]